MTEKKNVPLVTVRPLKQSDLPLMLDCLYEAVYTPEGSERPPRSVLDIPEMQVYTAGFGTEKTDCGFAAEKNGRAIGAVWARIMNDYGHLDDETPSIALALLPGNRGKGTGSALLRTLLEKLKADGWKAVSLSVQRSNPAKRLYQKFGFEEVGVRAGDMEDEIVMRKMLAD